MIELKFEGLGKLNRKLTKAAAQLPHEKLRFLAQEAELVKARTKLLTPVDTGRLRAAWSSTEPAGESVTIYNNTEYAPYVEFPHRIVAWGHDTGRIQPGNFMLRDAIDESAASFRADAIRILARIFR